MAHYGRSEAEIVQLVNENRRLVEYAVNRYLKRFYVGSMEREDLVAWGLVGLFKAAQAWDPTRAEFSTLAYKAIERDIIHGVRKEWKPNREAITVSLDELLSNGRGEGEDRFIEQVANDINIEELVDKKATRELVWSAIDKLDGDDGQANRDIITDYFYEDICITDIAKRMGLSRQGAYCRLKNAEEALADYLPTSVSL